VELLGVERVAVGAGDDEPEALCVDLAQRGDVVGHLARAQRPQLHARHRGQPLELGEDGPERVAAVQVVGAVGADHADPLALQHAAEEDQQVTGGAVGPVEVLDDEQHRLHVGQQPEQRAEQPLLGEPGRRRALRAGQQLAQHGMGSGGLAHGGLGAAQRVGQRQVGQRVAQLGALADQDVEAARAGLGGQLGGEPGLADAGVSTDERHAGHAIGGGAQRPQESGQLSRAPDE
jgi:hypothetical protein